MTQLSFSDAEYQDKRKQTRREKFLAEMEQVVPWSRLERLIEPHYPKVRLEYTLSTMLRVYFLQQWYSLSDPAAEDALYEITSMQRFAQLTLATGKIPDETTILRFRRRLEDHQLTEKILEEVNAYLKEKGLMMQQGTLIDATIINAPSSTKNKDHARDPEMHSTKKGNQYYFGMKAHIGVDHHSGAIHSVTGTAANVSDIVETHKLLHGNEKEIYADAGYTGLEKREEMQDCKATLHVAMKRSKLKALLEEGGEVGELTANIEKAKASVRAYVEHPFRILKCQFGYQKTRYRGLAKNTAQLHALFALGNLYSLRKDLMGT